MARYMYLPPFVLKEPSVVLMTKLSELNEIPLVQLKSLSDKVDVASKNASLFVAACLDVSAINHLSPLGATFLTIINLA